MQAGQTDLYNKGLKLLEDWKLDEAAACFSAHLESQPHDAEALNKLGVIYARQDKLEKAALYFEAAINNDPKLVGAYSNLGSIYLEQGEEGVANQIYRKALEIDPENATVHHNLGVLYKRQGRISEGVKYLKKANSLQRRKPVVSGKSEAGSRPFVIWVIFWVAVVLVVFFIFSRS